jgi:glycosyltransferase involved in cell wall biosynthesis
MSALGGALRRTSGCAVLVAQQFLPVNVVASQRALRMARTLLGRFERVYVFCGDTSTMAPELLDHNYGREVLADPRLVAVAVSPLLARYGYGVPNSLLQKLAGGVATRLLCGPGVDWIRPLRHAFARIPDDEPIRLVLATGPPFIPFVAAIRFAAERRAPAILDYRDLWTRNPHAPYPSVARALVFRWLEQPANHRATLLTTVSDGCRTSLVSNGATIPVRVLYNSPDQTYLEHYRHVVSSWHDRRVTPSERARRRIRVVFAGQVYRNCTFVPLLKALAAVPASVADQIEVHYYGDASLIARSEFEQYGCSRMLTDHGKVSKDDSLGAMLDADLLLSLIHTDRVSSDPAVTGHMSTKIYDYFLSGNPILNIGPVNADVNRLAAEIGHGGFHSLPADDTAAIARVLEDAVNRRLTHAEPLSVQLPLFETAFSRVLDEAQAV